MNCSSKKLLAVTFLCIIVFAGCRKEPLEKPFPSVEYPTIYPKTINQQDWEVKNAAFQEMNLHETLMLNPQGFLEGEVSYEADSLTLEIVVHEVQELISRYSVYMGIPSGQTFDLENMNFFTSTLIPKPAKLSGNTAEG